MTKRISLTEAVLTHLNRTTDKVTLNESTSITDASSKLTKLGFKVKKERGYILATLTGQLSDKVPFRMIVDLNVEDGKVVDFKINTVNRNFSPISLAIGKFKSNQYYEAVEFDSFIATIKKEVDTNLKQTRTIHEAVDFGDPKSVKSAISANIKKAIAGTGLTTKVSIKTDNGSSSFKFYITVKGTIVDALREVLEYNVTNGTSMSGKVQAKKKLDELDKYGEYGGNGIMGYKNNELQVANDAPADIKKKSKAIIDLLRALVLNENDQDSYYVSTTFTKK